MNHNEDRIDKESANWIAAMSRSTYILLRSLTLCHIVFWTSFSSGQEAASPTPKEVLQAEFKSGGEHIQSLVQVMGRYQDGIQLWQTPDSRLWTLEATEIISQAATESAWVPATADEIFENLQQQLPQGFSKLETKHFLIVHNTSDAYARWTAELFERIYRAFHLYWEREGIELIDPEYPLVSLVFRDKAGYLAFANRDIGDSANSMIGYYNMNTNRIISYDLTGVEGMMAATGSNLNRLQVIRQVLSQPQAERTVATIVHEAVHQLSFNCGLQTRLADNPLWYSEGLAMYFEAPDSSSSRGWGTIGKVNHHNLMLFRASLRNRESGSLNALIASDDRVRGSESASPAYPESWALTYFLMKTRSKEFTEYAEELSRLSPLGQTGADGRLECFQRHFGDDLEKLDKEFLAFIARIR